MARAPKITWTPLSKITQCILETGFSEDPDVAVLDIAPTMPKIKHGGKTYLRQKDMRREMPDGTQAAVYVWDGWLEEYIRRRNAAKAGAMKVPAPQRKDPM